MKSLYVGNLDASTTEQELRDAFAVYGDLQMVSLITDHQTAQPVALRLSRWKMIKKRTKRCWL